MSKVDSILQEAGLNISDDHVIENTGQSYYVHEVGTYQGLVEKFEISYKDAEGKKRDKDGNKITKDYPGAKPAHGNLQVIILKDPSGIIVGNDLSLPENEEYGKFIWNQYIPLESSRQWQNVNLFSDFVLKTNTGEELKIIEGDKGSEKVHLSYLEAFKGIPVEFTIEAGKKEGSRYAKEITLKDNSISKELLEKRTKRLSILREALDQKLEAQRKKSSDSEELSEPDTGLEDADSLLGDF